MSAARPDGTIAPMKTSRNGIIRCVLTTVLLGVTLLLASGTAAADDLYQAEVAVADQSEAARQSALNEALRQVLSKHSGLPADDVEIRTANLPETARLLQFVQYRTVRAEDAQGAPWQQLRLEASFVPARVDALVRELRLPRWSDDRPVVIFALVHAADAAVNVDGTTRREAALSWSRFLLADRAEQRGLKVEPLRGESADGAELDSAMLEELIRQGRPQRLLDEDDEDDTAILLGALEQAGDRWQIRWALASGDLEERFDSAGDSVDESVTEGLNQLVNILSRDDTISVTEQGSWQEVLVVESVVDARGYQRLVELFRNLRMVDEARLTRLDDERTEWQLELNASPTLLEAALERVEWLYPSSAQGVYRFEASRARE